MDAQQAISAKAHLYLIQSRLNCFREELESAMREAAQLKKDKDMIEAKKFICEQENEVRKRELENEYKEQISECKKQIKINEELLLKEEDKRNTLFGYLQELDIDIQTIETATDFNWVTLENLASNSNDKFCLILEQNKKAIQLAQLNERARERLNEIYNSYNSTASSRGTFINKISELKEFEQEWSQTITIQDQKIAKLRDDNTRLNLLMKQCVHVNEPMSKHISDTVRAKCQSFLHSKTAEELVGGLSKYKLRQERIIKLLKHKEKKLSRDINLLQVATDRTTDQTQHYSSVLTRAEKA